jgi:hypothetical protein
MRRSSWTVIAVTLSLTLWTVAYAGQDALDATEAVVVVAVEPRDRGPEPGQLEYSVRLDHSKLETALGVMDGLRKSRGRCLGILLHENVAISAVPNLVSMASKTMKDLEVSLFVFGDKRTEMMSIPGYRWVKYSEDPTVVGGLCKRPF